MKPSYLPFTFESTKKNKNLIAKKKNCLDPFQGQTFPEKSTRITL